MSKPEGRFSLDLLGEDLPFYFVWFGFFLLLFVCFILF